MTAIIMIIVVKLEASLRHSGVPAADWRSARQGLACSQGFCSSLLLLAFARALILLLCFAASWTATIYRHERPRIYQPRGGAHKTYLEHVRLCV